MTSSNKQSNAIPPKMLNDVSFKAEIDGSKQHYIEILPIDFEKKKKYDLLIGLHGHGSDRWQFAKDQRDECQAFRNFAAKYSMIAISPDYRATTSWMGPKAEADTVQIIDALKQKYTIRHVFLIGGSMGGTSALTFAALHPEKIDAVMSMNGLANHLEYKNFQDAIKKSFEECGTSLEEEKRHRSAKFNSDKLTMPIAFTTGGKDESVPPDSVLELVKILKKKKCKILSIYRPETGHETNLDDAMTALEFMYQAIQ